MHSPAHPAPLQGMWRWPACPPAPCRAVSGSGGRAQQDGSSRMQDMLHIHSWANCLGAAQARTPGQCGVLRHCPASARGVGGDVSVVPRILCQCRINHSVHIVGGVLRRRHGRKAGAGLPANRQVGRSSERWRQWRRRRRVASSRRGGGANPSWHCQLGIGYSNVQAAECQQQASPVLAPLHTGG